MITNPKILFLSPDAKFNLWSQQFQIPKTFLEFPFLDIYKCPNLTFPKYFGEKKLVKIEDPGFFKYLLYIYIIPKNRLKKFNK